MLRALQFAVIVTLSIADGTNAQPVKVNWSQLRHLAGPVAIPLAIKNASPQVIAFESQRSSLIYGDMDDETGRLRVYRLELADYTTSTLWESSAPVVSESICLSPDGSLLAFRDARGAIMLHRLENSHYRLVDTFASKHQGLAFTDNCTLVYWMDSNSLALASLDLTTNVVMRTEVESLLPNGYIDSSVVGALVIRNRAGDWEIRNSQTGELYARRRPEDKVGPECIAINKAMGAAFLVFPTGEVQVRSLCDGHICRQIGAPVGIVGGIPTSSVLFHQQPRGLFCSFHNGTTATLSLDHWKWDEPGSRQLFRGFIVGAREDTGMRAAITSTDGKWLAGIVGSCDDRNCSEYIAVWNISKRAEIPPTSAPVAACVGLAFVGQDERHVNCVWQSGDGAVLDATTGECRCSYRADVADMPVSYKYGVSPSVAWLVYREYASREGVVTNIGCKSTEVTRPSGGDPLLAVNDCTYLQWAQRDEQSKRNILEMATVGRLGCKTHFQEDDLSDIRVALEHVAVSRDGSRIAFYVYNKVGLLNVHKGTWAWSGLDGFEAIEDVAICDNDGSVIVLTTTRIARVNVVGQKIENEYSLIHYPNVESAWLSRSGQAAIIRQASGLIAVVRIDGQHVKERVLCSPKCPLYAACISDSGRRFVVGGMGSVYIGVVGE